MTEININKGICAREAEAIILRDSDEVVEKRLLAEFERVSAGRLRQEQTALTEVSEFSKLDEGQVFSENAHYRLLNLETGREFVINGQVLESKIGLDERLYEKVKSRAVKAFAIGRQVVTFLRWRAAKEL